MNEGEHIGDHLDHGRRADRAHMENLAAHDFESGEMLVEDRLLAADGELVILPCAALCTPPVTGASSVSTPCSAAIFAMASISSLPLVEFSIHVPPF